jgi:DNA modification methylase
VTPYYEHAGITIYHGDSHVLAPMLPAGTVNAIVTSPPYNQMSSVPKQATGMWARSNGGAGFVSRWGAEGYADEVPEPEYQAHMMEPR